MNPRATRLQEKEAAQLALDAQIVGLRWDLVEWALVLDINFKCETQHLHGKIGRAWLIFGNATDLSLPMNRSRLPNGLFSTYPVQKRRQTTELQEFVISVLLPQFDNADIMSGNPHGEMLVTARDLCAARSIQMSHFGQFGPSFSQRQELASDKELLSAIQAAGHHR